jgi:gluconate 2-dehydrogenase gamma chain
MTSKPSGRRQFLVLAGAAGAVGGAVVLGLRYRPPLTGGGAPVLPASVVPPAVFHPPEGLTLRALTVDEYMTLAAASERIFPQDGTPGAIALGVPLYVDRALGGKPIPAWGENMKEGLHKLDDEAKRRFGARFHEAPLTAQDSVLAYLDDDKSPEKLALLKNLVTATLEGNLGDPIYGGNVDSLGWSSLGVVPDPYSPSRLGR